MSYVEDITEPLINTLTHTGGLPARQLAGHAANLEFWVREVRHAFDVIDGYGERFTRLQVAERAATERFGPEWHPFQSDKLIRPGINDYELKELRGRLIDSISLVFRRCYKEGFVTEADLVQFANRLGLDIGDLNLKKGS